MTARVLIVDDSRAMRMVPGKILTSVGFEVHEAENGEDALTILDEVDGFGLFLIDWRMEGMSGLELVKEIRKRDVYQETPIIMITVENELIKVQEALRSGVSDYVLKPFAKDLLVSKLERFGFSSAGT